MGDDRIVLVNFEGTLWRQDLSRHGVLKMLGGAAELFTVVGRGWAGRDGL